MTTKQKKQIEALVKAFNARGIERDGEINYSIRADHYGRNKYGVFIYFESIFFSIDLEMLLEYINTNKLSMYIGGHKNVHVI